MVLTLALLTIAQSLNAHFIQQGVFDPSTLPIIESGVETHQFTSYDRAGDNYDADYFPLYTLPYGNPNGEQVLFDAYGPGCLYRLHANLWNGPLDGVNIRFYFDDERKPRIDMDVTTFFSPQNPLGIFVPALSVIGPQGYRIVYHPFYFARHLRVTLNKPPLGPAPDWHLMPWLGRYDKHPFRRNHWYNFTYQTFRDDPHLPSWSKPVDMSRASKIWGPDNIGKPLLTAPGQGSGHYQESPFHPSKEQEMGRVSGPGTITAMHFSVKSKNSADLFNLRLVVRFDGSSVPEVDVPLGCFFGIYRHDPTKRIASALVGSKADDMYCYLPMPFRKSAIISLAPIGEVSVKQVDLSFEWSDEIAMNAGTFHAFYHREMPGREGHDYLYVSTPGQGQVVGQLAYRWGTSMEEDERTYFDESSTPWIVGEGYEDDHNQGWGLKDLQKALWGSVASDGGSGAPWRFYIPDRYAFSSMIRMGHQVYGPHSPLGHEGMYEVGNEETVTFAYMTDQPTLVQTDEFDPGNSISERLHQYVVYGSRMNVKGSWWYDGEFNNVLFKTPPTVDDGVSTDKGTEFTVRVSPSNHGVRLRRRLDKENNRQLARVYVDGKLVTERPWFSVDFEHTFRGIRWFDSDFDIPAHYTAGKSSIRIQIEPISSKTGRWDEFRYWVYSYRS